MAIRRDYYKNLEWNVSVDRNKAQTYLEANEHV